MHYFFHDYNLQFSASMTIQRQLLSYMQVKLFNHMDYICRTGEKFEGIYLMAKNKKSKVII